MPPASSSSGPRLDAGHHVGAVENADREQHADTEQRGDRHVDEVQRDDEDHDAEYGQRQRDLKLGHG
jgi:hypothetical protein